MIDNQFSLELLHEVKLQAKRWFIAFCVVIGLECITIMGFITYISLPIDDVIVTQESDGNSQNNYSNSIIGGNNYGSETNH